MAEGDEPIDTNQTFPRRLLEDVEVRTHMCGSSAEARNIAYFVGRGEEQHAACLIGEPFDASSKHLLDRAGGSWRNCLARSPPADMRVQERELEQCQRIPERGPNQRIDLGAADRAGHAQRDKLARLAVRKPLQRHLGKARSLETCLVSFPCRDQHCDRLRMQASSREEERVGRRTVKPLRIVDQTEQRASRRSFRQQAQERQCRQESVVCPVECQPERASKGRGLRLRKIVDKRQVRPHQLMQRREWDLGLRLDAGAAKDIHLPRLPFCKCQQRRLPDARLAPNDEDATSALAGVRKQ